MRIGFNALCLEGNRKGEGRFLSNILKEWVKKYEDDEYILYLRSSVLIDNYLQTDKVHQIVLKSPFKRPVRLFWEHFLMPFNILKDKIDLFFSPSYTIPYWPIPCPSVVVIHDISYDVLSDRLHWKSILSRKLFSKISARNSSKIITDSEFSKNEIISHYNISESKIEVIYLGSDEIFFPEDDASRIKAYKIKKGLPDKFVLYVGSIFKRRNVDSLIWAFLNVKKKIPDLKLVIVGEIFPSQRKVLFPLINDNRKDILHYKYIDDEDLKMFYIASSVFVYPSFYEGFGLPPLEAMACGTPVIVGRGSSLAEIVGKAGLLVEPSNVNEIADSIIKILTDSSLRSKLVELGFKQVSKFSWRNSANKLHEVFENILDNK